MYNLQKSLKKLGASLSETEIYKILIQGILILLELEKCGVVHGNINEKNILIDNDQKLQLINFEDSFVYEEVTKGTLLKKKIMRNIK